MKDNKIDSTIHAMMNVEYLPTTQEEIFNPEKHIKLNFGSISELGVAFSSLPEVFRTITQTLDLGSREGVFRAVLDAPGTMVKAKDGNGYRAAIMQGNNITGQARFFPEASNIVETTTTIPYNPTMLFMAMAMANIDKKLDSILEIQQEMLEFLVQKERSELKGDLNFLSDILNNYKYNWDNEKYKSSNHIKVLDIRQSAERKIDFYIEQIATKLKRKSFFHSDQNVSKQLENVQNEFKDYQLALYLHSFSTFLEVILLGNFAADYLNGITKKIEEYSNRYRELHTSCCNQLEDYAKSSIQSNLIKGLANANLIAGVALEKVPLINKSQLDDSLVVAGNKINSYGSKRVEKTMQQLIDKQNLCIRPFVENINTINKLYNQSTELFFDDANLYLVEKKY